MESNKLIKLLLVMVIISILTLGGLLIFKYSMDNNMHKSDIEFYAKEAEVMPGTPKITVGNTSYDSSNFNRGIYRKIVDDFLEMSIDKAGESVIYKWKLTKDTTASCTDDIWVLPDGTIIRRSQIALINNNEPNYIPDPLAFDTKWLEDNAKNGDAIKVYGEKSSNTAKVILLYKDKCKL